MSRLGRTCQTQSLMLWVCDNICRLDYVKHYTLHTTITFSMIAVMASSLSPHRYRKGASHIWAASTSCFSSYQTSAIRSIRLSALVITFFHGLFDLLPVISCLGHLFLVAVNLKLSVFALLVLRHYNYFTTSADQQDFNSLIIFINFPL
jgi:hypothetical protein